jgi:hypothetical protein
MRLSVIILWLYSLHVMPALVAGIHVFMAASKTWMAGTSPAMTTDRLRVSGT